MTGIYVCLSYATFGIEVDENNIVTDAPPIAYWMRGKGWYAVRKWIENRPGWWKVLDD